MNIKLIALDVDGTLVDSSHIYISERNKLALRRCAEQGVEIVLASGRPMALIEPVAERIRICEICHICKWKCSMGQAQP